MLYNIWRMIQMWLPFWILVRIYKNNKALPANIKTRSGAILKAIMINDKNGILFTSQDYISNRGKVLQKRKDMLSIANKELSEEINNLSFQAREELFGKEN